MGKIDLVNDQSLHKSKIEMMESYLYSNGMRIDSSEICRVVKLVFGLNLDKAPILLSESERNQHDIDLVNEKQSLSRQIIDSFLTQHPSEVTFKDILETINQIFGINLLGISSLEGSGISLFSKDQWIVQHEKDLFIVYTGTGDIDVKILPTNYFSKQTGLKELPEDLQKSLKSLGYSYNEKIGGYYFSNPTSKAVPDNFKVQTMGAILKVIQESYKHLLN